MNRKTKKALQAEAIRTGEAMERLPRDKKIALMQSYPDLFWHLNMLEIYMYVEVE